MSKKTNEEKLRILQERLAQIKEKEQRSLIEDNKNDKIIDDVSNISELESQKKSKNTNIFMYVIILSLIIFGYYFYQNTNSDVFKNQEIEIQAEEELTPPPFNYGLEKREGIIVMIASYSDEISASSIKKDKKIKGYKCNYILLPGDSTSIYGVFIGPYENIEEANQWIDLLQKDEMEYIPNLGKNLNSEIEIINLEI